VHTMPSCVIIAQLPTSYFASIVGRLPERDPVTRNVVPSGY